MIGISEYLERERERGAICTFSFTFCFCYPTVSNLHGLSNQYKKGIRTYITNKG